MSRRKVRVMAADEDGQEIEIPLDDAPSMVIRLASVVHGRDLSDADYSAIVQGTFRGVDKLGHSL